MSRILTAQFNKISDLRRAWRKDMRGVFEHYKAGMKFRRENADWSEAEKREFVLQRLRFVVRRAENETVYYKKLFRQIGFDAKADFTFEDFAKIPVLEKSDISQADSDIVTNKIPLAELQKDATGGSTGTPTEIWLGAEERGWKESGVDYALESIGIGRAARTAYFWGHHLDPQATDSLRDRVKTYLTNIRWFDCFRLSPEVLKKYHAELEKFAPDCVIAYAGALASLAEFLAENNIKPKNYPHLGFVTGAEKLYPTQRESVEKVFGKFVHERYGGRDVGGIGIQKNPAHNLDFTVDWAFLMIEPKTDETTSQILVTKLRADGMPMLRYRIGDIAKFPAGSRSGHPVFALHEIIGRDLDKIALKDGRWIHGIEFPHLLKDFPVSEFMLVQAENYDVELQIVPKKDFDKNAEEKILQTIRQNLEGLNIKLKITNEIPRTKAGKRRPVVSSVA